MSRTSRRARRKHVIASRCVDFNRHFRDHAPVLSARFRIKPQLARDLDAVAAPPRPSLVTPALPATPHRSHQQTPPVAT
jgi:hypothetical protein